ncbi:MAG: hypothetical protein JSS66_01080 [Armatimonadetes bacterium]|nr:hypothetical protein [Armatimonadota bacterium]
MKRTFPGFLVIGMIAAVGCAPKSEIGAAPPTSNTPAGTAPMAAGATGDKGEAGTTPSAPSAGSTSTGQPTANPGTPGTSSGEAVPLRFAFDKGSEYKFEQTLETSQEMTAGGKAGGPPPMSVTSVITVKALDTGTIEYKVSGVKISGPTQLAQQAKALEGLTLTAQVDASGNTSNVKYSKGTRDQAVMLGIDTNDGFFGVKYPSNAVKVGNSWSHTFDFKDVVPMPQMPGSTWKDATVASQFALKSVDAAVGTALVDMKVDATPSLKFKVPEAPSGKTGSPMAGKEVTLNFTIKTSGTMTVELKNGIPKTMEYSQQVDSKDSLSGNSGKQTAKVTVRRL